MHMDKNSTRLELGTLTYSLNNLAWVLVAIRRRKYCSPVVICVRIRNQLGEESVATRYAQPGKGDDDGEDEHPNEECPMIPVLKMSRSVGRFPVEMSPNIN